MREKKYTAVIVNDAGNVVDAVHVTARGVRAAWLLVEDRHDSIVLDGAHVLTIFHDASLRKLAGQE